MNILTYHRVSTLDQHPETAREALHAAAVELGGLKPGNSIAAIEETGSGATNNRPGLLDAMARAERGDVDVLLVWKLDRFGRSALDVLEMVKDLHEWGVRFKASTQGIDVLPGESDAMGTLVLTVMAAFAEFERTLISERTREGMARLKRQGKLRGRRPVPRLMVERAVALREDMSVLVPDGNAGAVLVRPSWRALSRQLAAEGFVDTKGRPWNAGTLKGVVGGVEKGGAKTAG